MPPSPTGRARSRSSGTPTALDDDDPRVAATSGLAERYLVPPKLMAQASGLAAAPRVIAIVPQPRPRSFADVPLPARARALPGRRRRPRATSAPSCAPPPPSAPTGWRSGPGSADAFHPRAVRAAMGATFALPLLEGVSPADLATREGFAVVAAVPRRGVPPWETDLTRPLVLALGAERAGLGPALESLADGREVVRVTIPQAEGAESLNVAAAGAALLAEAVRQRATAPGGSDTLTGR